MATIIDMDKYKAVKFAQEFVAEKGEAEFIEFQKALREFLSMAEDMGLVPAEVLEKHGSIKNFKGE